MIKTVLKLNGKRYRKTRLIGVRRLNIPGMPWFHCVTNRWWDPGRITYLVTEVTTGFTPNSQDEFSRSEAIFYARCRMKLRKRSKVLAVIAYAKTGKDDLKRIPQRYRARTI